MLATVMAVVLALPVVAVLDQISDHGLGQRRLHQVESYVADPKLEPPTTRTSRLTINWRSSNGVTDCTVEEQIAQENAAACCGERTLERRYPMSFSANRLGQPISEERN